MDVSIRALFLALLACSATVSSVEDTSVGPTMAPKVPRECPCTIKDLWLDIIVVLDSSNGVSKNDFTALQALLIGFMMQTHVSQEEGKYTRLAIVNVAREAKRISNLTSYQSNADAMQDLTQLQFEGISDFNIAAGLIEAQHIIDETDTRPNAKNLVIIFASHGVDCPDNQVKFSGKKEDEDPCRIAAHMVEDSNTELMTVGLRFHEDQEFPLLKFGSPCYSAVNDINLMHNMQKLACKANCFCESQYSQFDTAEQCHSYGECVYPKGVAAPFNAAQIGCQLDHNTMVDVFSDEKQIFLREIATTDGQIPYWIGLQKKNGQFTWDTGSTLDHGDFTNWGLSQPDDSAGECIYVKRTTGFNMKWFSGQCSWGDPSMFYFCQKKTCDTDNYCETR